MSGLAARALGAVRPRAALSLLAAALGAACAGTPPPAPEQPIAFSHALHAGGLEMDCLFCHGTAEYAAWASVPSGRTCMLCHWSAAADSPEVARLVEAAGADERVHWARVTVLPDHVQFEHAPHVQGGVDCARCHGPVETMERVGAVRPFTMGFCVDCHRRETASLDCLACHH